MGLKENIKSERLKHGMTLENVANYIGVGRQTVQKYESGVVANIPSDKIELMARLFSTTPAKLMGWDENFDSETTKNEQELSPEEQKLIKYYQNVEPERQKRIFQYAKEQYESSLQEKLTLTYRAIAMGGQTQETSIQTPEKQKRIQELMDELDKIK